MSSTLVGSKVIVRGNEFIDQDIGASIVMIGTDNKTILLKLDEPLKNASMTYQHIIASPRLSKDDLGILDTAGILGCSITWVPEDKYNSNNPMDLSWWRGGAAAITDLCIN